MTDEEREEERLSAERSAMCSAHKVFEDPEDRRVWLWFPQLGGYVGHAEVQIYKPSGLEFGIEHTCFEISLYHDGEWPRPRVCHQWHACSPLQWVEFGLTVYEKQVEYVLDVVDKDTKFTKHQADALRHYRDRIDELLAKHAPSKESTP